MTKFAPLLTARLSTSIVAIAVVTTPVTIAAESPALNVSTVSVFHVTPTFCLMRSTISWAVIAAGGGATFGYDTVRAPRALTAASVMNSRREIMATYSAHEQQCYKTYGVNIPDESLSSLSNVSWLVVRCVM